MSKVQGSYIGPFVQVSDSLFFFFYIRIMIKKKHVHLYVCDSVNVILFFFLVPARTKVIRTDQDNVRVKQVQTKHVQQKRKNEILIRRDHAYTCMLFPNCSY
jgi:hypothetical protein